MNINGNTKYQLMGSSKSSSKREVNIYKTYIKGKKTNSNKQPNTALKELEK